jgi:hypothetical protein
MADEEFMGGKKKSPAVGGRLLAQLKIDN